MSNEYQIHYIGRDGCKVATCTAKQEFPEADEPYCAKHSMEKFLEGDR